MPHSRADVSPSPRRPAHRLALAAFARPWRVGIAMAGLAWLALAGCGRAGASPGAVEPAAPRATVPPMPPATAAATTPTSQRASTTLASLAPTPPTAASTPTPRPASPTVERAPRATGTAAPTAAGGQVAPQGMNCPPGYPIKGNRTTGREPIYHVPGGQFYERTRPEACFATEADARAAGYRRSLR